jgi:arsenate reductase
VTSAGAAGGPSAMGGRTGDPVRILVVCTGNSARSILGEALLRHLGGNRVEVRSAGTEPKGVNPLTLRVLEEAGISTDGLRSKAVTLYLDEPWDWVITVCDNARDTCPYVPGARARLHWSLPDPAAVTGTEVERLDAFRAIMRRLNARIRRFLAEADVLSGKDPAGGRMIALHLLRHAHAGDPARWHGDDAVRPLSAKGRTQAEQVAKLLAKAGDAPDLFITSPKVRALETAEIVAAALEVEVVVDARLAGPLDPGLVTEILLAAGAAGRPCIVGHDPEFSELLGELVGTAAIPMRKGALARVDFFGPEVASGRGTLRYLVPPELLPAR